MLTPWAAGCPAGVPAFCRLGEGRVFVSYPVASLQKVHSCTGVGKAAAACLVLFTLLLW